MSSVTEKIFLNDGPFLIKITDTTVDEQLTENASLRMILQWYERHIYRHLYLPLFQTESNTPIKCSHSDALLAAIELLYNLDPTNTNVHLSSTANLFPLKSYTLTQQTLLLTYESWSYTLRDLSTYSPYALDGCHLRLLFIIYQLLKTILFIHQRGLSCGPIQLTDIHINERYWIQLKPRFHSCLATIEFASDCSTLHNNNNVDDDYHNHSLSKPRSRTSSASFSSIPKQKPRISYLNDDSLVITTKISPRTTTILHSSVYHVEHRYETYCRTHIDIVELIKQWQLGHISNFDYLLILNALSGRKFHDPNNHLIFPWINDFTSSTSNLRDLSQSKYRLNKGDAQLDLTYNYYSSSLSSLTTNIVPHHLSEHLSSITYYVYKARRTEKRTLCDNVRSIWVPNEYPSSIGRLYFWTPEECIPEFFYDSSLFQSIHEDLPDLLVPDWCSSPEEFVEKHRQLLESREISENIHLWIDLIFGHKLTGESAVEAKNVCLPLVDHHEDLRNGGIVQLFLKPHPPRFLASTRQMIENSSLTPTTRHSTILDEEQTRKIRAPSAVSSSRSNESILLANELNDTFSHLDAIEQLLLLTSMSFGRLPSSSLNNQTSKFTSTFLHACQRDLQYFGVCLLELILLGKQHYISANSNGSQRLTTAKQLLDNNWHLIPIPFRTCLSLLLMDLTNENENNIQQQISNRAINVAFFLNRWTTPFPFPFYFEELYRFIHQFEQFDQQLLLNLTSIQQKQIHDNKFYLLLTQIPSLLLSLHTQQGHELLMPYILHGFRQPIYGIRCIYSLFNPIAIVLGPDESRRQLLTLIQSALNPDKTTIYHWRCFTRRFIIQLIARFNLTKFLQCFPILLIEACSGFKDEINLRIEIDDDSNNTTSDSNVETDDTSNERSDTLTPQDYDTSAFEANEDQQHSSNLLSDSSVESIIYLQIKLGPVLGCKYFGRHLLRMLALCYVDDEQLQLLSSDKNPFKSIRPIRGDLNAKKIIDCLLSLIQNYGEQIILLFYFPHLIETIRVANHRLTIRTESGLLSGIVFFKCILPYMSDSTLMTHLTDPIKNRIIHSSLSLLSSSAVHFPSFERARSICAYRILDVLFLLSLRLGYESTRLYMNDSIRAFFACFQSTHEPTDDTNRSRTTSITGSSTNRPNSPTSLSSHNTHASSIDGDEYCRITIDSITNSYKIDSPIKPRNSHNKQARSASHSLLTAPFMEDDSSSLSTTNTHTRESIQQEIDATFTSELACTAFVQFCRLCGDQHMNSLVTRNDTIYAWIAELTSKPDVMSRNDSISASDVLISIRDRDVRYQYTDENRFLRKNWLSYWEHEVGRSENAILSFKQIHLQSFIGHTNAVRSLCVLDDESTFISGGRDQKLLVWKVENQNDNATKVESRWSYSGYRKSVFAISFLESLRLAATCDGSVHILDPFRGQLVYRYTQSKETSAFAAMAAMPAPSTNILAATSDGIVRFLDVRTKALAYEWKTTLGAGGQVKTLAISPNAHAAVIGFTTGTVSVFDVRSGGILGTLKVPEGEVLKANFYSRSRFFTSSGDGSIFLWNTKELAQATPTLLKLHTDPAPFVLTTRSGEFIVATQTNKLCIYSNMKGVAQMDCQCTRLQSDNIKGTISSMALFPENRLLLFGSDNGNIELLC
ncbi:unnamed protein product [Rotaria sordida]|uniref:BEACH domain-containing protein n=1 Tax=Rotaria sordida TaxID=392033 RepID=A0A813Q259_9BILA|nr:unnamed protein product [Rotaria sordida]CAF0776657.1 unnamed protein product [Rotaria sordida]CAF0782373.1 unnamed protein product [Rotaria sordida]CAF3571942.1 unnamed protein product [Rotaria sordida]